MLVLTRRAEESIIASIGQAQLRELCGGTAPLRMVFKILEVDHGKVRVGITAPESVTLLRDEVERRQAGIE